MAIINAALMSSDSYDSFKKDLQKAPWKWNMGNSEPMTCYKDKPEWTKIQSFIEQLIYSVLLFTNLGEYGIF